MTLESSDALGVHRIVGRLSAVQPRLALAIAPAGYGKSTVVRQYARGFDAQAVCDCLPVASATGLAQAVAAALALDDPGRTAELAQQRLSGRDDTANWSAFALNSWTRASLHDLIVFENVEAILDSTDLIEFLLRLLARAPHDRRIAICSRRPLPFSWHRLFAPHDVFLMRAADLRFEAPEIAHVFASLSASTTALERIADITQGWPIAVFLLARLARETSVGAVVERVGGLAFEGLYEYLADQVLAAMPPARFDRLLAVAAIPRARAHEVALALSDPAAADDLPTFSRASPFLYSIDDDVYEAHPLVRAMLAERYAVTCRTTLLAAARALAETSPLRAGQLYLAAGDQDAAATIIAKAQYAFLMRDPPPLFAEIVANLDRDVLMRHPATWQASSTIRVAAISLHQWLEEALIVRTRITAQTPAVTTVGVLSSLGNVLINLGRHDEARAIFEQIIREYPDRSECQGVASTFIAMIEARRGNFTRALETWHEAKPNVSSNLAIALSIVQTEALVFRYRGDRATERARTETAIALARESRSAFGIVRTLVIAAFGAWFAGDDDEFTRYLRELEAALTPTTARWMEVFCASARGDVRAVFRSEGIEPAKLRCYAALVACGQAEGSDRADLARAALKAAEDAVEPANVTIACIACAESIAGQANAYIGHARTAAATVDSEELRAAVGAYARGSPDLGLLGPLVRRLRAVRPAVPQSLPTTCDISLARALVERDGKVQRLTARELELVLYLAARHQPCRAEDLVEALWPRAERPGTSVLRVCIRRARLKLGEDAIVAVAGGYALGRCARVDLEEIEAAIAQARQQQPIAPAVRLTLATYLQKMSEGRPTVAGAWDWFSPVGGRIDDLARELAMMLARDALRNNAYEAALAYSQCVIERDACDEPARELRIRAHLGTGDRAAALRELRVYRNTLALELEAVPSASLFALVGKAATAL